MLFTESDKDSLKAWFIFSQVCISSCLIITQMNAYSLIYIELMSYFNFSSAQAQFLPSIYMGARLIISPLIVHVIQYLGYRVAASVGAFFIAFSNVCCFFSTNYISFIVSIGIIPMLNLSLVIMTNLFIIKEIFREHQRKAFGLLFTSYSLTNMGFQYFFSYAIEKYSIRGAFLILACIQLHALISVQFYQNTKLSTTANNKAKKDGSHSPKSIVNDFIRASNKPETMLFYLAIFFSSISTNTGYILIMDNAHLYHYEKQWILFLPVLEDFLSIPVRLCGGAIFDIKAVKDYSYIIYSSFVVVFAMSHLLNSFAMYGYSFLVATMTLRAIGKGVYVSQLVLPCIYLAKADVDVPAIFAIGQSCRGTGVLVGNLISGYLKDIYGTYQPSLYFLWATHICGSMLYLLSSFRQYTRAKNEDASASVQLLSIEGVKVEDVK